MHDILVVGTGFSGSILARKFAEDKNKKILLLEERPHIAGNMYDEIDEETGILVQKYGPHFLNTDKYWIIDFLSRYAELTEHNTKLLSFIDNNYIQLPFNFKTLQQLVGVKKSEPILKKMRESFKGRDRVTIFEISEHEDSDVRAYGTLLFEKAYIPYTCKMWGLTPEKIDKSVLNRVQMSMGYDERYLNKDFQYLPTLGFTNLFENIINHPNITLKLGVNALDLIKLDAITGNVSYDGKIFEKIIFTGPIDELFGNKFGKLPYRSLNLIYETFNNPDVLKSEIISFPQADGYTRKTEYRKINYIPLNTNKSVVVTEYPLDYSRDAVIGNLPYYPTITEDSQRKYAKYFEESKKYKNLYLCGRLAEFKYYNMDLVIESTFENWELWKDI